MQHLRRFFGRWGCMYHHWDVSSLQRYRQGAWSIFFLQATHSPMQEVAKPNTVENFLKDLSSCVTAVTFLLIPVKIQTVQSHASGYKIMMIRVLQGISALHSSTQQTVPWVTHVFGDFGNLLGSMWLFHRQPVFHTTIAQQLRWIFCCCVSAYWCQLLFVISWSNES